MWSRAMVRTSLRCFRHSWHRLTDRHCTKRVILATAAYNGVRQEFCLSLIIQHYYYVAGYAACVQNWGVSILDISRAL